MPQNPITIKKSKEPDEIIKISAEEVGEVFRVENSGDIYWKKNGKMVKVEMEKDLALAFALVVSSLAGYGFPELMERIRKGEEVLPK